MQAVTPSIAQPAAPNKIDTVVLLYLQATDEAEAERLLARLLADHADPLVKKILGKEFRCTFSTDRSDSQDADEVYGSVVVRLLQRLRHLKVHPGGTLITDFGGYVAVTTFNAYYQYLRQRYPERFRLKNHLRYLLTHHDDFALWDGNETLCGFAGWRGRSSSGKSGRLAELRQQPRATAELFLPGVDVKRVNPADLLTALFKWLNHPIQLDHLVNAAAELWGVRDLPCESIDENSGRASGSVASRIGHDAVVEQRSTLGQLWAEICQLPVRQRTALLLNLRDAQGRDVITLLPETRTASIAQIAEALQIPLEQFARMWNDLPLEDATIAEIMGITRQQVINLRKSARERLNRRVSKKK